MGLTVLLALAFSFTESRMTQTYDRNLVEEVRVENNHRIPADSIKYRIQTKPGDRFDLRIIDADIRRIYALDQFDDIRVNYEEGKTGRIIIFWVKEKKVSISPETPYDPRRIKKAEALIKSILSEKGHEDARVTSTTEDVPTN